MFTGILLAQCKIQNETIAKCYIIVLLLAQSKVRNQPFKKITSVLPSKLREIIILVAGVRKKLST